jgi:subtilisin-like proprotein convertase family protein
MSCGIWSAECAEQVYRTMNHCVVVCGDGLCAAKSGESCATCPDDCGQCNAMLSCSTIIRDKFLNSTSNIFEDPLFASQWHLYNTGQTQFSFNATPGNDINVLPVYQEYQIFGNGVIVSIVDDGVEWRHQDLQCGYQPELSADIDLGTKFQQPTVFDAHGTCCAGICCGQGNNSACGIGVAFKSKISAIRVLGNAFSDANCAEALVYEHTKIDIYSNSWGPSDDGGTIERYPLALAAIEKGIKEGRNGLGAIYVWAAGNGYERGDGSNFDELANSPYTICIGATDWNGITSTYSEPGTNVIATAPSNTRGRDNKGQYRYYANMITADRMGWTGYNSSPGRAGNCAFDFGGTSAACPVAAGIMALLLEANPKLTWRDVQWIIVKTSTRTDVNHSSWSQNGAGYYFSKHYGYGRLNAYRAVTAALSWTNVCSNYTFHTKKITTKSSGTTIPPSGITIPRSKDDPLVLQVSYANDPELIVEHVSISISASIARRGKLVFLVESPNGTISVLCEGRNNDYGSNYDKQVFTSVQFWGESSIGTWSFAIYDKTSDSSIALGTLTAVEITILGAYKDCKVPQVVTSTTTEMITSTPTATPNSPDVIIPVPWLSEQVRNIIAVTLFSSLSMIVVIVVLVWVLKMQGTAEKELNSEIWGEMTSENHNSKNLEEGTVGQDDEKL